MKDPRIEIHESVERWCKRKKFGLKSILRYDCQTLSEYTVVVLLRDGTSKTVKAVATLGYFWSVKEIKP